MELFKATAENLEEIIGLYQRVAAAMEELMKREGFGMDDIFPGMLDYCTYMGQGICAVPFGISTQVMYYNKTLLEKAGVDMTNPPKTWQEFYDLCADLLTKVEGDDFTAFDN